MTALVAAGAVAALELDAASVGPFLLSRPFVMGPLIGWALGDAWSGAAVGATLEALTLEEAPLGGRLDVSAAVAAGVAAILIAGPAALPGEAAVAGGLAAGLVHARVEAFLRRVRGGHARRVESDLSAGRPPRLGAEILKALAVQALATFAVAAAAALALGPVLSALWARLPAAVGAGLRVAYLCAPWIGAGALAASLARKA